MYVLSLSRNLLRKNKQNEQWHQQTQVKFFHVTNKVSITKLSSHEKSDLFTRSLKTGAIENSVHIYVNIFFLSYFRGNCLLPSAESITTDQYTRTFNFLNLFDELYNTYSFFY